MTTREPIIRLERDETSVAVAHSAAAPRPPMMAITAASVAAGGRRRRAAHGRGVARGLWYHPPSRPEHDPFRAFC